jgi:prepilin-type N-terminal cleavage/methylation domain-containing protein
MKVSALKSLSVRANRAFSLTELLVAISLLTVIVLALYSMFDQTQKALHAGVGQTDVMESGRSAMDLLVREVERARAVGVANVTNFAVLKQYPQDAGYPLPGILDNLHRDTPLTELFYLTPTGGRLWTAMGWFVADENNPTVAVNPGQLGSLYRYEAPDSIGSRGPIVTNVLRNSPNYGLSFAHFWDDFLSDGLRKTNASRLVDGVVFFRTFPFDSRGRILDERIFALTNVYNPLPNDVTVAVLPRRLFTAFSNQAMPYALEVEFGVLPPRLLNQYRSLDNFPLQTNFLAKHSSEILIFRQRIPFRTALP